DFTQTWAGLLVSYSLHVPSRYPVADLAGEDSQRRASYHVARPMGAEVDALRRDERSDAEHRVAHVGRIRLERDSFGNGKGVRGMGRWERVPSLVVLKWVESERTLGRVRAMSPDHRFEQRFGRVRGNIG